MAGERLISSAKQELREDGTGTKSELAPLHVVDRRTGDIRRHQVGGELNSPALTAQYAAQRSNEKSLPQPGHRFDQDVTAGEQCGQRSEHQFILAHIQLGDLSGDPFIQFADRIESLGRLRLRGRTGRSRRWDIRIRGDATQRSASSGSDSSVSTFSTDLFPRSGRGWPSSRWRSLQVALTPVLWMPAVWTSVVATLPSHPCAGESGKIHGPDVSPCIRFMYSLMRARA